MGTQLNIDSPVMAELGGTQAEEKEKEKRFLA